MVWRAVCIAKLTQHHEGVMAILLHDRAGRELFGGQRPMFMIGERIRNVRQQQGLSQKHIEERTGLLRCYVSRVENGHTVPSLETLERFEIGRASCRERVWRWGGAVRVEEMNRAE